MRSGESTGPDALLLTDANQNLGDWKNAASYMLELAVYYPLFIEEAIAYNDVLGYIRLREGRWLRRGSVWRAGSRLRMW